MLATLGLAGMLLGCGASIERVIIRYRDCVQPEIRYVGQDNGITVPEIDWRLADARYLNLNETSFLPEGTRTQGNIPGHDHRMYDMCMDLADTNSDRQYDLVRVTFNTTVIEHPDPLMTRGLMLGRAMVQDRDHDGRVDAVLVDNRGTDGSRWMDGVYDEMQQDDEIRNATMEELIEHWLIFLPPGEFGNNLVRFDRRFAYRH